MDQTINFLTLDMKFEGASVISQLQAAGISLHTPLLTLINAPHVPSTLKNFIFTQVSVAKLFQVDDE